MSARQRNRGNAGERECAKAWQPVVLRELKRKLGQARDGGYDLTGAEPLLIEVKRRKRLETVYNWMRQVKAACTKPKHIPVVAFRADNEEWLVVLPLDRVRDFVGAVNLHRAGFQ